MNFYALTSYLTGAGSIILCIIVFSKRKRTALSYLFCFLTLCIAWYSVFIANVVTSQTKAVAVFWVKFLHLGVTFIPVAFLHFALAVIGLAKEKRNLLIFCYLLSAFLIFLLPSELYVKSVQHIASFNYFLLPGRLYFIHFLMYIFLPGYAMFKLFQAWKGQTGRRSKQAFYIFFAGLIGFLAGSINYLPTYGIDIPPVTNFLIIVYIYFFAYAIVKYNLMDIEVFIKKTAIFTGLFVFVLGTFILITFIIQDVLGRFINISKLWSNFFSTIIIIMLYEPVKAFLISTTDKFLFQKKYDYKELLKTFTGEVLTVLDLSKLVNVTTENLSKIIRLESCAVLIHDKDKDNYPISASLGLKEPSQVFAKNTHIINYLLKTQHYLLKNKTITDLPDSGTVKEDLKKLSAELVIPIVLHDDLMGALTLGRKKSGEDFTQDDLDILLPLSQTLAVAISNAQYFFELSKTQQEAAQREKMAVIGTLAAGINHEICNPLGIARGQSEAFLLNKRDGIFDGKPESEQLKEAADILQLVIKEVDRATAITKKLSTFAKPSKGEFADDVDIAKEVDEVLALIGYELRLDKIEFVKNVPPALPHIRADKKQIQEILFNLIRNAAQAISESGKITVSAYEQDSKVFVDIADTGCGIPEDKLGMIFNPFYTTKEPGKGTGLGLFIVRQVVERNKGKISLKSKINEGTTFTLEFPISR